MEGQKNQNRAMVTWYGQHIRFEQGSCQFLRGVGAFASKGPKVGGEGVVPSSLGLLAGLIFIIFFFYFLFLLYLTLPTCTLLTLDPCFYCFSLQRRPIDKAKRTLFFLGNFAFMYFPSLITYTR